MQEVFASVAVAIETFQPTRETGSFRAWLWTITRRKVLDHLRKVRGSPEAAGGSTALGLLQQVIDPDAFFDEEPSGENQIQQLTHRALTQVRSEFEDRKWQAFWRCVVDGISTDQVADELGLSSASVRQSRSRILRRLRQQLGDLL